MVDDIDVISVQKVNWEKIGELTEGKILTIKVDNNILFSKKVPLGKYFNGRIMIIGELVNNEDRPVEG